MRIPNLLAAAALAGSVLAGCAGLNIGGKVAHEDGRFTIGAGGRRLMYGYPIPYSTSHFVVVVDGRYASNSPSFPATVEYLTGDVTTRGAAGSPVKEITYRFGDIDVTQRLIPVDGQLRDVPAGRWGRYYRIEYELRNYGDAARSVGLALLIDTMIDDNDASQMDADGTRVARQARFAGDRVPHEVLVYRTAGSTDDFTGSLITDRAQAVRPDLVAIGRWPLFHTVLWEPPSDDIDYTDSAILLRWDERSLAPGAARTVATYYGMRQQGELRALTAAEGLSRDSATVYFDLGKSVLTDEAKQRIDRLVDGRSIAGAIVEVYADAVGDAAKNLALSKRRAQAVQEYLRTRSVDASTVIPKAYGESYALQTEEARKYGRQEDRRATVVIFQSQ